MNKTEFYHDGELIEMSSEKNGDSYSVTVGDSTINVRPLGNNLFAIVDNGPQKIVAAVRSQGVWHIDVDSVQLELSEPDESGFGAGAGDHGEKDKVYAPMPGKIVKLLVEVGQEVDVKTPLVIVEAMKMENQVNSKAKGKVKAINFAAGDQVDTETPIIELELETKEE